MIRMIKSKNTNPVEENSKLLHGEHFAHLSLLMRHNLRVSVIIGEPQSLIMHPNSIFDRVPNIETQFAIHNIGTQSKILQKSQTAIKGFFP